MHLAVRAGGNGGDESVAAFDALFAGVHQMNGISGFKASIKDSGINDHAFIIIVI